MPQKATHMQPFTKYNVQPNVFELQATGVIFDFEF